MGDMASHTHALRRGGGGGSVLGTSSLYRGLTVYRVVCVLYRGLLRDMVSHTYVLVASPLLGAAISRPLNRVQSLTSLMVLRLTLVCCIMGRKFPFLTHPHEPHTDWVKPNST